MRADSPPRPPPASQRDRRRTAGALRAVEVPTPAPADGPALLDARPRRPRLRPGLVRRRRLVRPLTEAVAVPLAIVIAPAGYGKTTLLAEWAAADERPFAWLTLFERDNDPVHLLGAVIESLHELEPFPREVFGALMTARSGSPAALLPTFAGALESRRRRCVLVLDDVHAVRAPAALEALRTIADHIGAGSVLALASRTQPALPIGRLRAEQGVVELGTEQLAMTEREAMQLLRGDGVELRQEDARAILRRTEGWPAGLHLAARALGEQHDTGAAIARFRGDDRLVADYLREEVLSRLDADELAFMLGTSPLEALSDELCAAVLDEPGCGRTLHELARSNLLLVPLDRREERFRHHTLLGEMLQAELRRTEPQRAAQTHRRASDWHERHGDVARALDHAISANETDRAGQLLWALTPAYAFSGRDAAIGGWLERFGEAQIAARPALALAAATHRLLHGERDGVEGLAAAAERGLDGADPARRGALAAGAAIMRAVVARDGLARMGEDAARAYALAADDDPLRSFACLLEGTASQLGPGDRAYACQRLEEGVRRAGAAAPSVQALCLAQLALLALEREDWAHGTALAERARTGLARAGLEGEPICALVLATSAFARAQRAPAEAARRDAAAAERLLAVLAGSAPWQEAQIRIVLARAQLRLSDAAQARLLLTQASRMLRAEPDAVVLRGWIDDAWGRADAFAADAADGPARLTIAELRVLRFLPSHFSFREIAARLHVSANTIKSQAHAVYFKLDVSSRSEAVARAREVGLVDGWPPALE